MMDKNHLSHRWYSSGFNLLLIILPALLQLPAASGAEESEVDLLLKGKTSRSAPVKFRVIFKEPVETRYAVEGDLVEATLQQALVVDNHEIAPADSPIFGHIESVTRSKKLIESARNKSDRFNRRSTVKITFDRIGAPGQDQVLIEGELTPQNAVFSNGEKFRRIVVGEDGNLVKAESLDIKSLNELGIHMPESALVMKDRYQINLEAGDTLMVRAEVTGFDEAKLDVSAKVISKKREEAGEETH